MVKYIITILAVGSIAFMGLAIDTQSRPRSTRPAPPAGPELIYATGRVEGISEPVELRPVLAGRVDQLHAAESSQVKAGDVLLKLDDRQYQHEVALAQAQLQLAQAKLERLINGARSEERREAESLRQAKQAELQRAQLNWNRINELRIQNAVTQQEADDQRMEVDVLQAAVEAAKARSELLSAAARPDEVRMAQATVAAAQARLETAQLQLDRTQLIAPSDGLVLQVNVEVGELAGPDSTAPTVVMADARRFRVRAFVEEYDAPRVRVGMLARVTADGVPGQTFAGTVARLSPRMDRKQHYSDAPDEQYDTKTREVWIDLQPDATAELVIGLRVDVVIEPCDGNN